MRTAEATPGEVSPSPWNRPRRDDRDGCDGFFESGAVCKTSSRSSRPSRGAGPKVKGPYLGVEIAVRQYNPNPLTFGPRRTLAGWGERLCLSPLPNGECQSLGGVQGALFKGQPCWGSRPQTAGATPPLHPVGRKCAFDGRKAVKSAFALLSQKVTKAAAGAAKGVLI